jgi:hypothetical protein
MCNQNLPIGISDAKCRRIATRFGKLAANHPSLQGRSYPRRATSAASIICMSSQVIGNEYLRSHCGHLIVAFPGKRDRCGESEMASCTAVLHALDPVLQSSNGSRKD